jgi:GntR family transcriptional repressor for pyruvate dehydrogenase complex
MNSSDSKKIQDLLQVRSVLEPAIAALAARNATAEDIAKMEQALQDMEQNVSDGYKYIEADNAFHNALAEASKNSVFQLLTNSIVDLLQESRRLATSNPGAAKRANKFHQRILQAVSEKNINEAVSVMRGHMRQAAEEVWATASKQPLFRN